MGSWNSKTAVKTANQLLEQQFGALFHDPRPEETERAKAPGGLTNSGRAAGQLAASYLVATEKYHSWPPSCAGFVGHYLSNLFLKVVFGNLFILVRKHHFN